MVSRSVHLLALVPSTYCVLIMHISQMGCPSSFMGMTFWSTLLVACFSFAVVVAVAVDMRPLQVNFTRRFLVSVPLHSPPALSMPRPGLI